MPQEMKMRKYYGTDGRVVKEVEDRDWKSLTSQEKQQVKDDTDRLWADMNSRGIGSRISDEDLQRSIANTNAEIMRKDKIKKGFSYVFISPLISLFRLISTITKVLGKVLYLGIIVGLWFVYDIYVQVQNGIPFAETENKLYVCSILLPLAANLISLMSEKYADYLYYKS